MDEIAKKRHPSPTCPRCGGHEFITAEIRRDPKTLELIHQYLCVKEECQVVLGVMTLKSLVKMLP